MAGGTTADSEGDTALLNSHQAAILVEIEVARRVQAAFLPKACSACPGAEIAARQIPSRGIAGDLYDFIPCNSGMYSLVIGDVIGHQLFSALVMSLIFGAIHVVGPASRSPRDIVTLVNDLICRVNDELRSGVLLCSLFYGTVDPHLRRMEYVNAGHPAPFLWREGDRLENLEPTCPVLGADRSFYFGGDSLDLNDVVRLLLYTDGLTESRDSAGRFFGTSGIVDGMGSCSGLAVEKMIDCLVQRALDFIGGKPRDDLTVILAEFQDGPG